MSSAPVVTRIGNGVYRVEQGGRADTVFVAGSGDDWWVHWNGEVYHRSFTTETRGHRRRGAGDAQQSLSAPMPATVLKLLVQPGSSVRKGDTLVILEAMKMELPVRATADATVRAVRCREGELVQPGAVLVDLE